MLFEGNNMKQFVFSMFFKKQKTI